MIVFGCAIILDRDLIDRVLYFVEENVVREVDHEGEPGRAALWEAYSLMCSNGLKPKTLIVQDLMLWDLDVSIVLKCRSQYYQDIRVIEDESISHDIGYLIAETFPLSSDSVVLILDARILDTL